MPPVIALTCCVLFVAYLLIIERKTNREASFALWIPTLWILISGSRPVARWFESSIITLDHDPSVVYFDELGSPIDRIVLSSLIILALIIVFKRRINLPFIFKSNIWLIILYSFIGLSIIWADHPYASFKRWIRLLGVIPIALVVLSERNPLRALESILRRSAYILIPFSILLIKYYPHLGVTFGRWSGLRMWVGVALQKNGLGILCCIAIFFFIWKFIKGWKNNRKIFNQDFIHTDLIVSLIAGYLALGHIQSYSATAIMSLFVGCIFLITLIRKTKGAKSLATVFFIIVCIGLVYLPFDKLIMPTATSLLGRNESLTGRTDIWRMVIDIAAQNPWLGVGYGSFWGLEQEVTKAFGVKEGHNGFLDVYLDVGIIGIIALLLFLIDFFRKVRKMLDQSFYWGVFGTCFLLMLLVSNYTEGSFLKTSSYMWNLSIVFVIVFTARKWKLEAENGVVKQDSSSFNQQNSSHFQ